MEIIFILIMLLAGSFFTVIYLAMTGNAAQMYTDIVAEFTAIFSSNKSAERNLIYILIFGGVMIYMIYYMKFRKGG